MNVNLKRRKWQRSGSSSEGPTQMILTETGVFESTAAPGFREEMTLALCACF